MTEDKLTHDERLRLESLAQATALFAMGPKVSAETIIEYASRYETYIAGGSQS